MIEAMDDAAQPGALMNTPSNVKSWLVPVIVKKLLILASPGHAPTGSSGLGAAKFAWCFVLALRWICIFRFVQLVVDND